MRVLESLTRGNGNGGGAAGQHCVGCPAIGRHLLEDLVGDSASSCGFDSLTVEARGELPASWAGRYSLALVRRGYVIRQRIDRAGHAIAIDAVGPGCGYPLDPTTQTQPSAGYAVSRALVCLCDDHRLRHSLEQGGPSAVQVHELDREATVRVERLADARGRSSARGKVAALLCTLADTLRPAGQSDGRVPADFLQRDLAALLSIRHESVCRVMRDLEKQGLIAREDIGVALLDRDALSAL